MSVLILRGTSGSGKSTAAKYLLDLTVPVIVNPVLALLQELKEKYLHGDKQVFSADHYFTDDKGEYHFNPRALGEAHGLCYRKFIHEVSSPREPKSSELLIVDNTNCSIAEVAPYAAAALAFHHELMVFTFLVDPVLCAKRNTHGVSEDSVRRQAANLEKSLQDWPSFWPSKIFPITSSQ